MNSKARGRAMNSHALVVAIVGVVSVLAMKPAFASQECDLSIVINGQTGAGETGGEMLLAEGDKLCILIEDTIPGCYDYNLKAIEADENKSRGESRTTVKLSAIHSRKFSSYHVAISKKTGLSEAEARECPEPPGPWDIAVHTVGWAVAFSPAFTVDSLTDEDFTLVESSHTVNGEEIQGFVPRRVRASESDYKLGAAAFAHLYLDDSRKTNKLTHWAPLSFGLGLSDGSDARYFLGTSLRFGDSFFLTAGAVFGSRITLPAALAIEGAFTEDANALASPSKKTDVAAFIAVSLKLGSVDIGSKLAGSFAGTPEPN